MISVTWPQVQWSPSLQLRAFVCVEVARFEQRFDINFDTLQDPRLQRSAVEDALRPAQAGVVFRRS